MLNMIQKRKKNPRRGIFTAKIYRKMKESCRERLFWLINEQNGSCIFKQKMSVLENREN